MKESPIFIQILLFFPLKKRLSMTTHYIIQAYPFVLDWVRLELV